MSSRTDMTCGLKLDTKSSGWQKTVSKMLKKITGPTYSIDAEEGMAYISGRVNPKNILKKLMKSTGKHAELCWVETGDHADQYQQYQYGGYGNDFYQDDRHNIPYRTADPYSNGYGIGRGPYWDSYQQGYNSYYPYQQQPMTHYYPPQAPYQYYY